jgi:site-specific recombinase XerD
MYQKALRHFGDYAKGRNVTSIEAIDAGLIREYLLHLEATGHNPGGVRWFYRHVKAFLNWYEQESAPDGWRNPIRKIKTPKVPEKILEPISLEHVGRMLEACDHNPEGLRDRATLLTLTDTGAQLAYKHQCSVERAIVKLASQIKSGGKGANAETPLPY